MAVCYHTDPPLHDSLQTRTMAKATAANSDKTKHPLPAEHGSDYRELVVNAGLRSVHQSPTMTL